MDIRFYNSLTHQLELFKPIEPDTVYMYNCGPTVYDYAHIGNFRTFVFADVLRRFLELAGNTVHQVMNITDVGHMTDDQLADGGGEDKMAAATARLKESKKQGTALVENPDDPYAVAEFFTMAFIDDAKKLRLKIADEYPEHMPRASQHVKPSMIPMIRALIKKDHAYVAQDGAVYFSVRSFPKYGQLSGNSLDHLKGGAGGRVQDSHQTHKRHPADFLLWKPDPTHLMKWDSPWGEGYPGWHIECSAMAKALLGRDTIDIHTGGEDNIFPHHECEIAQTCGASGHDRFANFWLHSRFLLVEGEKMSKSKGNFHTVRDVLEGKFTGRPVDPAVLRYELIRGHYRKNYNFTANDLEFSAHRIRSLRMCVGNLRQLIQSHDTHSYAGNNVYVKQAREFSQYFRSALSDDLRTNVATDRLGAFINSPAVQVPAAAPDALNSLEIVNKILAFTNESEFNVTQHSSSLEVEPEILEVCQQLDDARQSKDFDKADAIRQQLIDAGYDVKTTKDGTVASRRLA